MDYLVVLLRIATIIPLLLILTLLMGKRVVGELQVFDFLIVITIGSVVGADIADLQIEHGPTALAILLLAGAQWGISRLNIKNRFFGQLTTFEPTIVIQNGQILHDSLKRTRYSLDTLLELMRQKDVFRVSEVEFAILEANGKMSVLKKSQFQPLTPSDTGTPTEYYGLSHSVILEGKIVKKSLQELGIEEKTLLKELQKQNFTAADIFHGELDTNGHLHLSPYKILSSLQDLRH